MAFVTFLVGVLFLASPSTLDLPPYEVVSRIATPFTWGVILTLVGMARLLVLYINGAWSKSPHLRWLLASASAVIWAFMFAGLTAFSTPLQIGPFIAGAVFVDLINAFRAAQDARVEDESGAKNGSTG